MTRVIHIVCPDNPSPPNYGGVIDLFYKIKALHATGVEIILHYFNYNRERAIDELVPYCKKIYAYSRKSFLRAPAISKPYIVASRISDTLISRLNADDYPVFVEYIHCTGIIPFIRKNNRKIVVRLHNDEAIYYRNLAKAEITLLKKTYYTIEGYLLKHYQKILPAEIPYAAVSKKDAEEFKINYGLKNTSFIPVFLPWQRPTSKTGNGTYCLYHGNLSVIENEKAVVWLLQHVFSQMAVPFVIAGKNVSTNLKAVAKALPHVQLINDPTDEKLSQLIEEAHIHVLPDLNQTGVKLKLLHALFCGRFCVTNHAELPESSTIALAKTPEDYMRFLKSLMERSFTEHDRIEREQTLQLYNNMANAEKIKALLW